VVVTPAQADLFNQIMRGEYQYLSPYWDKVRETNHTQSASCDDNVRRQRWSCTRDRGSCFRDRHWCCVRVASLTLLRARARARDGENDDDDGAVAGSDLGRGEEPDRLPARARPVAAVHTAAPWALFVWQQSWLLVACCCSGTQSS
jgi:hypothetical protein